MSFTGEAYGAAQRRCSRFGSRVTRQSPRNGFDAEDFWVREATEPSEHVAGYGRTQMWNDYFSAYQTASAKCDQLKFGWDRKLVCSMTMPG